MPVNAYLDRVVVAGGFLNAAVTNAPAGRGSTLSGGITAGGNHWWLAAGVVIILQDLDNPRNSWEAIRTTDDNESGSRLVTFQGVTAKRFSITNTRFSEVPTVFDGLVLGEPD
jgi:hypothetical protein